MRPRWLIKGYAYKIVKGAPSVNDIDYPDPFVWVDTSTDIAYLLSNKTWSAKAPDSIINDGLIGQINVIGQSGLSEVVEIPGVPVSSGFLPNGAITGDIIRWNAATNAWEVKPEPFSFTEFILTPVLAALIDAEGAIYYNATHKAVMVCIGV
jgi:hypothetical protein